MAKPWCTRHHLAKAVQNIFTMENLLSVLSEGEDFKYKQTLIIKEDGVYVKEMYQYLKIFLIYKKRSNNNI